MLKRYLYRLYDTIISRGDVSVENLIFDDLSGQRGSIEGKLKFYDESLLEFVEAVTFRDGELVKLRYAYHYQDKAGTLVFRYDNAPHYPNISTYPHHKHVGDAVEPADIPDLANILGEIDQLIYDVE